MHHSTRTIIAFAISVLLILSCLLPCSPPPFAHAQEEGVAPGETLQTNPKSRGQTVTASVSDTIDPSTPVLISPEDDSLINESLVTFVWSKSTDEVGIDSYQLYLDGALYFADIPTSDTENDAYTLDYDGSTGYYTLTVAEPIDEGEHTWKVVALDAAENETSSVTWSFSLDSLTPAFIISQVGDQEVSISAQDTDSIPATPILLSANSPLLLGAGESDSSGTLTIWRGSEQLDSGEFTIDGNGEWNIQLGVLPRDVVLTLDFTVTDAAGNVTILEGVSLIIQTEYFQIPPLPSSQPTTPTLPGSYLPGPSPTAISLPGGIEIPTLVIKKIPPQEIVSTFITQASEVLPEDVRAYTRLRPLILEPGPLLLLLFWLPATLIAAPVFVAALVLWGFFEGKLTFVKLRRTWQALGLWPWSGDQVVSGGLVVESISQHPVAFARVIITGIDQQKRPIREILVTDERGLYHPPDLNPGTYQVYIDYPGSNFPSTTIRHDHIPWYNHYRGENLVVGADNTTPSLVIPIDPPEGSSLQVSGRAKLLRALSLYQPLSLATFILACIITALYPTAANLLVTSAYLFGFAERLVVRWRSLHGFVGDTQEDPLPHVVIRLYDPRTPLVAKLAQSNASGRFSALFKGTELGVQAVYFGWKMTRNELQVGIEQREQVIHRISSKQLPSLTLTPPAEFMRE